VLGPRLRWFAYALYSRDMVQRANSGADRGQRHSLLSRSCLATSRSWSPGISRASGGGLKSVRIR
jgi:hypothetical protein